MNQVHIEEAIIRSLILLSHAISSSFVFPTSFYASSISKTQPVGNPELSLPVETVQLISPDFPEDVPKEL